MLHKFEVQLYNCFFGGEKRISFVGFKLKFLSLTSSTNVSYFGGCALQQETKQISELCAGALHHNPNDRRLSVSILYFSTGQGFSLIFSLPSSVRLFVCLFFLQSVCLSPSLSLCVYQTTVCTSLSLSFSYSSF